MQNLGTKTIVYPKYNNGEGELEPWFFLGMRIDNITKLQDSWL